MENKTYQIWIEVEERSANGEFNVTILDEFTESVGGIFDTLEEALEARRKLIELL